MCNSVLSVLLVISALLRLTVLFVDAQRDPQQSDAQLLDFLEFEGMTTLVVATKCDKLSAPKLRE